MELQFQVTKQSIKRTDGQTPVSDSVKYLSAEFNFDSSDWDNTTKTATFRSGVDVYTVLLDSENKCLVPWELIRAGKLKVSVYGDGADEYRITADTVDVTIYASGFSEGEESQHPTPSQYEQLASAIAEKSNVTPNPTLLGGEANLGSVEIDGVKFKIPQGGGGSSSLEGLTDVDLDTPTNGQVLKYNSTSEKWENANESGGGTEVIANPTLAGTEANLTGLQVGNTKYKVPSGGGGGSSDDLTLKLIEASGMDVTNFADVTGLEYTTGKYISKTNGKTQQDYAYSKITTFNVQEGEIYHVYTRSIGQTVMYALYDANGDAIEWYPTNTMADGQRYEHRLVIIPSNAKTMAVGLAYTYNYASTQNPIIQKTTIDDVEFGVDHGGNVLYGKKWCSCGDSFTAGEGNMDTDKIAMQPKTYPYLITQRNHMAWQQLAIGGATFTNIEGAQYCFTDTTASKNYTQIAADCDYVTFSYGLNEGSLTAEQIGAKGDATTGTLWGAWDTVVKSVLTANPTVKLGIIIEDSWLTQTYHDALIDIAKYYMIPYLDLRNGEQVSCNIGGRLSDCSADVKTLRDNAFKMGVNDAHPNSNAHKYRSTMIENFLRSL